MDKYPDSKPLNRLSDCASMPLPTRMTERLATLTNQADELGARLSEAANMVAGPIPPPPGEKHDAPNCHLAMLDELIRRFEYALSQARRINDHL